VPDSLPGSRTERAAMVNTEPVLSPCGRVCRSHSWRSSPGIPVRLLAKFDLAIN
jgi:hypothetical protein